MITSVQLINFQGHINSFFKFDKGVNSLIGETDKGKSSVIRGIKWVATNRPLGDAIRTHGSTETAVVIGIGSGHYISKVRSDTENYYEISKGNNVIETLKAAKGSVPDAVTKLLNLSDINFQSQHDAPYLFSNTSGDVAQTLNNAVSLDLINSSLTKVKKMLSVNNAQLTHYKKDVAQLKIKSNTYDYIDNMERAVIRLERKERRKKETNAKLTTLTHIIKGYEEQFAKLTCLNRVKSTQPKYNAMLAKYKTSKMSRAVLIKLQGIVHDIHNTRQLLRSSAKLIKNKKRINGLLRSLTLTKQINQEIKNLSVLVHQSKLIKKQLVHHNQSIKKDTNQFNKLIGKKCPICKKPYER